MIDTGSFITGLPPWVFTHFGLPTRRSMKVVTPSTIPATPHSGRLFHVELALVAGTAIDVLGDFDVLEADCFHTGDGVDALIGRDILDRCVFEYAGPHRSFRLCW